eukprot:4588564-Amphidinium_carterae.3
MRFQYPGSIGRFIHLFFRAKRLLGQPQSRILRSVEFAHPSPCGLVEHRVSAPAAQTQKQHAPSPRAPVVLTLHLIALLGVLLGHCPPDSEGTPPVFPGGPGRA